MKKNILTADAIKAIAPAENARFSTVIRTFKDADATKVTQGGASMGILLNEGDQFIVNELLFTEITNKVSKDKANTLAFAISRVVNGNVSSNIEILPLSRFVNTLVELPDSAINSAKERINKDDVPAFEEFMDYAKSIRNDEDKVYYRGEGAVAFGKRVMGLSGTAEEATVFTVARFHSHVAKFEYSPKQAEVRGEKAFTATQQYYVLSV